MPIKIGIIGRLAEGSELCDGQTIKTRVLLDELRKKYPDAHVLIADTYNYKKNIVPLIHNIEKSIRKSDIVFILLSRNGRRFIFPIVNFLNLLYRKPIFHDVIGGAFEKDFLNNCMLRWHCNQFVVNWVESRITAERLQQAGHTNVEYLPNFKRLTCVPLQDTKSDTIEVFKFCTFSRVIKEKGISSAAQAVIDINQEAGYCRAVLDIYGPFENDYENELEQLIKLSNGAVRYKGIVEYDKSVSVLKNYDMLLFPTYFSGEGFPGTLIDAFSAGLPVIASDWHYNSEIITNGKTGFVYNLDKPHQLTDLMEFAMEHPLSLGEMRKNCLDEAKKYSADSVMATVEAKIDSVLKR